MKRATLVLVAGAAAVLAAGVYLGRSSTSSAGAPPSRSPSGGSAIAPIAASAAAGNPGRAPTPALPTRRAAATPALAADLTDPSPRVRAAALRELARDPDADPASLLVASNDPDLDVALVATALLGKRYASGAVPVNEMVARASDRTRPPRVRTAALDGLGIVAAPEAVALLTEMLAHGDPLERRSAAILLVHQDPELAIPALIGALGDADEVVRANALDALRTRSRGRDFGADAAAWLAWWRARPR